MITRINFIEKRRFQITYKALVIAVVVTFLFCAMIYGVLFLTTFRAKNTIQNLQTDIERLKQEREKIISQKTTLQGQGPYLQIQQALENAPSWSRVLEAINRALPPRVWLGSLKSSNREATPPKKEILLNGQAKNAQVLALFLANLQKSPAFEKVVLTSSQEEASGVFQFSISCDIGKNAWSLKP